MERKFSVTKETGQLSPAQTKNLSKDSPFLVLRPKGKPVLFVQMKQKFTVHAPWGKLVGEPGDCVVKYAEEGRNPDPKDVWIVSKNIFESTYKRK